MDHTKPTQEAATVEPYTGPDPALDRMFALVDRHTKVVDNLQLADPARWTAPPSHEAIDVTDAPEPKPEIGWVKHESGVLYDPTVKPGDPGGPPLGEATLAAWNKAHPDEADQIPVERASEPQPQPYGQPAQEDRRF